MCQICGRDNHEASWCYHRFDHNYVANDAKVAAAVTNSYVVDTNWYADTGATDHVTNDLERLPFKECYTGNDRMQVANGAGLSIAHIGSSSITAAHRSLVLNNILHV